MSRLELGWLVRYYDHLSVVLTNQATDLIKIILWRSTGVTISSLKRHSNVTQTSLKRDNFVTSCNNLVILKTSRTKLCHFTNQHIGYLTVQKNPVKFLATQHFRHIPVFTNFDQICRSMINWVQLCMGMTKSTLKCQILDILTAKTG